MLQLLANQAVNQLTRISLYINQFIFLEGLFQSLVFSISFPWDLCGWSLIKGSVKETTYLGAGMEEG